MFINLLTIFLFIFSCVQSPLLGYGSDTSEEEVHTGILIVSYNLEADPERLDRIRFILASKIRETMYPKKNAYVENEEGLSRLVAIENLPLGTYKIKFLIPNTDDLFEEVPDRTIVINKNSVMRIDQNIRLKNKIPTQSSPSEPQIVHVSGGKSIIGDAVNEENINELKAKIVIISPFSIGVYPVTNTEYVNWLNQALSAGKIFYVSKADNEGQIIDKQDRLLCKTTASDPFSQISAQQKNGTIVFATLPGKESYPVINVTWIGASLYCQDSHCRLPTEAEWEKAAGVVTVKNSNSLNKFRFGFSQNEIDPSWANYKSSEVSIQHFQVLTSPVGFYNGINKTVSNNQSILTHDARSPYGAFDMSGNVWEWVSDWYDPSYYKNMPEKDPKGPDLGTLKVVKGGCYDSSADGVRITERLGLPTTHADAYTGFRIVKE